MEKQEIKEGQLVQLNPETVGNPMFSACIMVVTEPKSFGAQGYVQSLGIDGEPGGKPTTVQSGKKWSLLVRLSG